MICFRLFTPKNHIYFLDYSQEQDMIAGPDLDLTWDLDLSLTICFTVKAVLGDI